MISKIYYIGFNSKFLQNDGNFGVRSVNTKIFNTEQDAVNYIDNNLQVGEYLIIKKIVKS